MSIHLFTRLRKIFCQLLLLALFATLLPAYHVSAAEQVVVIPKDKVSESLWRSVWKQHPGREYYDEIQDTILEAFDYEGLNSPAALADYGKFITQVNVKKEEWLRKNKPVSYRQMAQTIFDMASDYPALYGTTKAVWKKLGGPDPTRDIMNPDIRQAILYDHELEFRQRIDDFGLEIWNKAKADS